MAEQHPLAPLATVHRRLADLTTKDGILLRTFAAIIPRDTDGTFAVQGVWVLDEDWKPSDAPEEEVSDPEFERVIKEAEDAEREQKATEAREQLSKLRDELKDPSKGIGLDD